MKFPGVCLQNVHLGFMDKIAEKTAARNVLYLGVVTEWPVNVKVDVKLDGRNLNVTQVRICHCLLNGKRTIFLCAGILYSYIINIKMYILYFQGFNLGML